MNISIQVQEYQIKCINSYHVYCTVFCSRSALTIISQFIYPPKQPPAQEPHRLRNSEMDIPGLEFKDITGQTFFSDT